MKIEMCGFLKKFQEN